MSKNDLQSNQPEREILEEQLNRIFRYSRFKESDILKRFLLYIVEETLEGRSNCLKEYTIAVHALNKPPGFRPQDNGIVRIHAGRLRRALNQYYREMAKPGETRITIPKGKYVPLFNKEEDELLTNVHDELHEGSDASHPESLSIAVLPFTSPGNRESIKVFSEGLCMQISSALMKIKSSSVMAYQAVKAIDTSENNFKTLVSTLGVNYIITGNIQFVVNRLRLNIQMIRTRNAEQVWASVYEKTLTASNSFSLQDEIAESVLRGIEKSVLPVQLRISPMAIPTAI